MYSRFKSITQTKADSHSACDFKVFYYNSAIREAGEDTGYHVGYQVVQDAKRVLAQMEQC